MKKFVLAAATCAAFTTTAIAEPGKAQMQANDLRDDMIISTHAEDSGNAMMLLSLLALLIFVVAMNNSGHGYYYTMSDERLKTDIKKVGMKNGLPIYQFRYIGVADHVFEGVMAQDVLKLYPDAVHETKEGRLAVNYDAIGVQMKLIQ